MHSDSALWGMIRRPVRGWGMRGCGVCSLVKRKSISELIYCVSMETVQSNGLTLEQIR